MQFRNEREFLQFVDEHERAYDSTLDALADRQQRYAAYYEGKQWQAQSSGRGLYQRRSDGSILYSNYNPDQRHLRVVRNFTTSLVNKLSAQTFPQAIEAIIEACGLEAGMEQVRLAQVFEEALNILIPEIGYLEAARGANHARAIMGDYGIGLTIEGGMRTVDGEQVYDKRIKSFSFPATRLVLDPGVESRDLREHEFVEYRAAWTIHKIRRVFPEASKRLNMDLLPTFGHLAGAEFKTAGALGSRLYEQMKQHSKTKAAWVKQVHIKDEAGRFSQMVVCIDGGADEPNKIILNLDNPVTPFGGDGLPFIMLHSHRREGSPFSISDVGMIVDDQNRANLADTLLFRSLHKHSIGKWIVDENFFAGQKDEWKAQLNNLTAGFVSGRGGMNINAPKFEKMPDPPAIMAELAERERISASDKVSRPRVTQGELKTHTPFGAVETALEQANQVGDVRVSEDIEAHAKLLKVACGTIIRCVQQGAVTPLAALRDAGMGPDDLGRLATAPDTMSGMRVAVRQSAVRHRSHEARKADLTSAFQLQAMTPVEYRMSMARDLDQPLVPDDRTMASYCQRAAERVLLGEEWQPISMGIYNDALIQAFRRAQFDRRAELDPASKQRLQMAIQGQILQQTQEMMLSQPPEPEPAPAAAAPAGAEPGGTVNPAEALALLGA